jgi:hypothetical protein
MEIPKPLKRILLTAAIFLPILSAETDKTQAGFVPLKQVCYLDYTDSYGKKLEVEIGDFKLNLTLEQLENVLKGEILNNYNGYNIEKGPGEKTLKFSSVTNPVSVFLLDLGKCQLLS